MTHRTCVLTVPDATHFFRFRVCSFMLRRSLGIAVAGLQRERSSMAFKNQPISIILLLICTHHYNFANGKV